MERCPTNCGRLPTGTGDHLHRQRLRALRQLAQPAHITRCALHPNAQRSAMKTSRGTTALERQFQLALWHHQGSNICGVLTPSGSNTLTRRATQTILSCPATIASQRPHHWSQLAGRGGTSGPPKAPARPTPPPPANDGPCRAIRQASVLTGPYSPPPVVRPFVHLAKGACKGPLH